MENKILTIVVGTTMLLTSMVLVIGTPSAYAQSHYQIGYNDGCAGNMVSGPHLIIKGVMLMDKLLVHRMVAVVVLLLVVAI